MEIKVAKSDDEVLACFSVMAQLRPHLVRDEFVAQVRKQERHGYRLASLTAGLGVISVAGYRVSDALAWGHYLYVDDFVTDEAARSNNYGQRLFDWLVDQAQMAGCQQLHLDSGVQRFAAHRFYLRNNMEIRSHHFTIALS